MTREEAIQIMENEQPHCGKGVTFTEEEKYEAYDMAIEALKAEPCEDAVKREAVIAVLDWHEHEKSEIESYIREIAEDIKALPPVTPKQNDSINAVLDEIKREFKIKADGDDWYHTTDGLVWEEAIEILDKHRAESEER